ncbi:adenosine receptor A2b-like [Tubulanus polymorphus]|uniref:adenosine receptor A2b-like n=1 Tax=Tubulanus polymorphus TaxID=672921 RepID=UPI003DA5B578
MLMLMMMLRIDLDVVVNDDVDDDVDVGGDIDVDDDVNDDVVDVDVDVDVEDEVDGDVDVDEMMMLLMMMLMLMLMVMLICSCCRLGSVSSDKMVTTAEITPSSAASLDAVNQSGLNSGPRATTSATNSSAMTATDIVNITVELGIAVAAILGNSLVIAAVMLNSHLRTVTNYFIVNLAIADFLVGLVALPCAIAASTGFPYNDFYGCLLVNSIVVMLTQSSIFSLLAIALERFVAIKHPYVYQRWCSGTAAVVVIIVTWLASLLIGMVPVFGWHGTLPPDGQCSFMHVIDMEYMVYFNFFGCVLIPLLILLAIYAYIFFIVKKQLHQIAVLEMAGHNNANGKVTRHSKAAKSLAGICVFFAICWLPLHILNSLTVLRPDVRFPFEILMAAILLSHANSAVNPVLYALGSSGFRRAFKQILSCNRSTATDSNRHAASAFGDTLNS